MELNENKNKKNRKKIAVNKSKYQNCTQIRIKLMRILFKFTL